MGMVSCSIILIYVQNELSYDKYNENAERIYRVVGESINPYETFHRARTPNPLAPTIKSEFPEVVQAARIAKFRRVLVKSGSNDFYENRFFVAEPSIFDVFTFKFLEGDQQTALTSANAVVITESTANRYFGSESPLGKILTFENRLALQVTGVIEDVPKNSHFHFDLLASAQSASNMVNRPNWIDNWNRGSFYTYLLLKEGVSPNELERKFPAFVETHIRQTLDDDENYKLHLQPLTRIHHHSQLSGEIEANSDIRYVYIFSSIALIVLLIACVNYTNLSIARSANRLKEIGVRKVLGANRNQLIKQFLGDSILMSLIAVGFTIGVVELLLPKFGNLLGEGLPQQSISHGFMLICLALFVGLVGGSYPAFFLSALKPLNVLQGKLFKATRSKTTVRGALVIFQFSISIALISATQIIYNQLDYFKNKRLGFNKEQVVIIPINDREMQRKYESVKNEFLRDPAILAVAFSSGLPGNVRSHATASWGNEKEESNLEIYHIMVDYDFIDLYEIELAAGRRFSKEFTTDATEGFILNEAAVKAIGWQSAIGKKFTLWGSGEVVGVSKDFHFESLHKKIEPLAFHFKPGWFRFASLKMKTDDVSATLAFLERKWQEFSPDRPFEYFFLNETFDRMYRTEEKFGSIFGYFTFLAIFIACLGLLALASNATEQRVKEIGIRKVMGASVFGIVHLLSKDFLKMIVLAIIFGGPIAYFVMNKWLQDFAYRIEIGWGVFALAGGLTLLIALLTVISQAIRAALANPVKSLRYE